MDKLRRWVEKEELHSPGEWLDQAQQLAVLLQDLAEEKTKAEIEYEQLIIDIMDRSKEEAMEHNLRAETSDAKMKPWSRTEAEARAKVSTQQSILNPSMTIYRFLKYLENRYETVMSLIQICKKRSETRL